MRSPLASALFMLLGLTIAAQPAAVAEPAKPATTMQTTGIPDAAEYTSAPLRNRIRVELAAPASEVWGLVGDLSRFPEYSFGLSRVDVDTDGTGAPTGYLCHFKPLEDGGEAFTHRENFRWYEPGRGYASTAEEPNAFGMTDSLARLALAPAGERTIVTYDMYYNAADLEPTRTANDQALADIGDRLIARFGGRVIERFVEPPTSSSQAIDPQTISR